MTIYIRIGCFLHSLRIDTDEEIFIRSGRLWFTDTDGEDVNVNIKCIERIEED